MTFNFNPPSGAPTPNAAPAATPFAPPAQAANPMTATQALAGFGAGAIDMRNPFLPLGFAGEVELIATQGKDGREVGFAFYIEVRVTRIASAGGGDVANQMVLTHNVKNANTIPAQIGNTYTIRISGFSRDNSRAFAISDTKLFLCAIMEEEGLKPDTALPPAQWDAMANAMQHGKLNRAGRRFLVNVSAVGSKAGAGKVKVAFFPPSAVAEG